MTAGSSFRLASPSPTKRISLRFQTQVSRPFGLAPVRGWVVFRYFTWAVTSSRVMHSEHNIVRANADSALWIFLLYRFLSFVYIFKRHSIERETLLPEGAEKSCKKPICSDFPSVGARLIAPGHEKSPASWDAMRSVSAAVVDPGCETSYGWSPARSSSRCSMMSVRLSPDNDQPSRRCISREPNGTHDSMISSSPSHFALPRNSFSVQEGRVLLAVPLAM
jgi:hypothetical protein